MQTTVQPVKLFETRAERRARFEQAYEEWVEARFWSAERVARLSSLARSLGIDMDAYAAERRARLGT